SSISLGAQLKPTGDRPSGRDLIAEAVESGDHLLPPEKKSDSKVLKKTTQQMPVVKAGGGEDEAVDLGAPVSPDAAGSVHARSSLAKKDTGIALGKKAAEPQLDDDAENSSGVDLDAVDETFPDLP